MLFIIFFIELDPRNIVSFLPLKFSNLFVKICPLSRSAHNCISSIATKSKVKLIGIASTVQTQYFGFSGIIRSSPVIKATYCFPHLSEILSKTSLASNLNGKPIIPLE